MEKIKKYLLKLIGIDSIKEYLLSEGYTNGMLTKMNDNGEECEYKMLMIEEITPQE